MSARMLFETLSTVPPRELLNRIRRNHALEHATINLLTRRYPGAHIAGLSGPLGFTLLSSLTGEQIVPTIRHALNSLKTGEEDLAVHENCGTNLVITAALTTLATVAGLGGYALPRNRSTRTPLGLLQRFPQIVLLNVIALVAASPMSRWVQSNVTTSADLQDVEIASIVTDYRGHLHHISVHTRHGYVPQSTELAV
jgi:hypothetical protein